MARGYPADQLESCPTFLRCVLPAATAKRPLPALDSGPRRGYTRVRERNGRSGGDPARRRGRPRAACRGRPRSQDRGDDRGAAGTPRLPPGILRGAPAPGAAAPSRVGVRPPGRRRRAGATLQVPGVRPGRHDRLRRRRGARPGPREQPHHRRHHLRPLRPVAHRCGARSGFRRQAETLPGSARRAARRPARPASDARGGPVQLRTLPDRQRGAGEAGVRRRLHPRNALRRLRLPARRLHPAEPDATGPRRRRPAQDQLHRRHGVVQPEAEGRRRSPVREGQAVRGRRSSQLRAHV